MITKRKFMEYEKVRLSGKYNMIIEADKAMKEAKLTKEEYLEIIRRYEKYKKEFLGE